MSEAHAKRCRSGRSGLASSGDAGQAPGDGRDFGDEYPRRRVVGGKPLTPARAPVDSPRSTHRCRRSTAWPGWGCAPQRVDVIVDGGNEFGRQRRRRFTGQAALQRRARTGDGVQRRSIRPQPPPQLTRIRPRRTGCRFKSRAGPERSLPRRRQCFGGVIELVHERLDNRCRVVDFGLQQFTGALVQPYQPVIGQHDMGHHRQTAADDDREQQVFDGRACRRGDRCRAGT